MFPEIHLWWYTCQPLGKQISMNVLHYILQLIHVLQLQSSAPLMAGGGVPFRIPTHQENQEHFENFSSWGKTWVSQLESGKNSNHFSKKFNNPFRVPTYQENQDIFLDLWEF